MARTDVDIDLNAVKRVSAEQLRQFRQAQTPQTSQVLSENRKEVGKLLRSHFDKAGMPLEKLDRLAADAQAERRRLFAERMANRAKAMPAAAANFRQSIQNQLAAMSAFSKPFQPTFIVLDTPVFIIEEPHQNLGLFLEQHIEATNSFVRIGIDAPTIDYTSFGFWFLWENPSQFGVGVNIKTALVFNGVCTVLADTGFFSGDTSELYISAGLRVWRWTGWGPDPNTGADTNLTVLPIAQSTLFTNVTDNLTVTGGGLIAGLEGDPGFKQQVFNFQGFPLSANQIIIPGSAVTLFEVYFTVQGDVSDPGDEIDQVNIDFAFSDVDVTHRVTCPLVALELLTGPLATV